MSSIGGGSLSVRDWLPTRLNPTQVYMMDKRLVDPRRPRHEKLTEAEREERLQPYSPQLYQAPTMFVTYNRDVPRLAGEGAPHTPRPYDHRGLHFGSSSMPF